MAHFAQIDESGTVTRVLVIEQDVIDTGEFGDPTSWVRTSYNTRGGVYYTPNTGTPDPDQSKAFRKNFAGIGFTFDPGRDAFIPPKDYPSWVLNEFSCKWEAPVPMPDNGIIHIWDEDAQQWLDPTQDSNSGEVQQ